MGISRRRLVQLLTAGVGGASIGLLHDSKRVKAADETSQAIVKPAPSDLFYQKKTNLEMRWEAMYHRGYLVPNNLFFVRNNSPTPQIDPARWQLTVEGSGVSNPRSFSYDELLSMPSVSTIKALECAGNGRSFYKTAYGKEAEGTQWLLGGIGVAEWTGVPLREVLERAGLKRSARDVMPVGVDAKKLQRPLSVEKAIEDALLVYAMNGDILPPDHGFPVRVLVPGWAGIASVKWVGSIQVSEKPLYSEWNTKEYVLIGLEYPPEPGSPALGKIITTQVVKSAFELPWDAKLSAGQYLLRGRSWSGQGTIAKAEVSLDGGRSWQQARLHQPNFDRAWVRWDIDWSPQKGTYQLQARATDDKGNTQPASVPFNEKGYLYGGIINHPVTVT
jgi:DMSO/TMAO reductase YedYZ molybdopterin-dependent catalytic subunit